MKGHSAMFTLDGVSRSFGPVLALAPLSLEISHEERVAVLGPSGSGKTTLLHLLGGVVQPSSGHVFIDGHRMSSLDHGRDLAELVGIIHQQFDLVPHLTVVHNVLAGRLGQWGLFHSLISLLSPRDRHLAVAALRRVGIEDKLNERTSHLSGGEQQRVAIARVLVQAPRAILADEPVASLDPARAADLIRLLAEVSQESGRTLVASLHAIELARPYFTRAIGMRAGVKEFDLPIEQVTDPLLNALYDLEGVGDGWASTAATPRRTPSDAVRPVDADAAARGGVPAQPDLRRMG
ncbi:MAG: ATP-binding cassette domain-containing protein [Chloroflexi bacterium]|nr:ATP-binding cassette domain-containing protein [Chloroflexota bacterium]